MAWIAITTAVMAIVFNRSLMVMNIWNNIFHGLTQIWEGIKMIFHKVFGNFKSIFLGAILIIISTL